MIDEAGSDTCACFRDTHRCQARIGPSIAYRSGEDPNDRCMRSAVRTYGEEALCTQHLEMRRRAHHQILGRILSIPIR
jgi:hypothetical protein